MLMEYRCVWFEFTGRHSPADEHGIMSAIYRNTETGEEIDKLPPGALLEARSGPRGYDGKSVVCVVPYEREGVVNKTTWWHIDSRASNCDKPDDTEHRCWCRHGSIGETVHVDKVGNTCNAGAGSIQVPGFHGFLHNGVLKEC